MTTDELIDQVLAFWENVDPDDYDNTQRRRRILMYAQMTVDEVRRAHPWPFALVSAESTLLVDSDYLDLPSDFDQISRYGGFYRESDGTLYSEIPIAELQYARQMGDQNGLVFSIFGRKIQMLTHPADSAFLLNYKGYAPPLEDGTFSDTLEQAIPVQYHHTVILPGVITKTQVAKGDVRDFEKAYNAGMAQMVIAEMTQQSSPKQMPMHPAITMNLGGSF